MLTFVDFGDFHFIIHKIERVLTFWLKLNNINTSVIIRDAPLILIPILFPLFSSLASLKERGRNRMCFQLGAQQGKLM